MPLINNYHINLELHDKEDKVHYQFHVDSLRNCLEDFKFSAFRKGVLSNNGVDPEISLEPLWEEEGKSPYSYGFRLCLNNRKTTYKKAYSKNVFKYEIYRIIKELMKKNELEEGLKLQYRMAVFHKNKNESNEKKQEGKISVTPIHQPMPVVERSLKGLLKEKKTNDKGKMTVWIAEHVVKEIIDYVLQNKESERAGFLLGHFCQDPETKVVFLVCHTQVIVKGQFPNENTSSLIHFQFSPEIFYEVQQVITLRKKQEIVLGWWHSHPWPFACEKGNKCECTSVFFSAADFEVMEAAFGAPYQVALVIGRASLENMEATAQMYGWKDGLMVSRDYYEYDAARIKT